MTWRRPPPAGFSLVELMTVLAIAAILLAIAVVNMRALIRSQQLKVAVGDLIGAIDLTRSQAIARGRRVYLVPSEPAGADWTRGWVVFVDSDGDRRPGRDEDVIVTHGPLAEGMLIDAAFSSRQTPDYVAYNAAGRSCTATSSVAARWGTLSLFHDGHTRRIKINMLGRARACDPARDGAGCAGAEEPP